MFQDDEAAISVERHRSILMGRQCAMSSGDLYVK